MAPTCYVHLHAPAATAVRLGLPWSGTRAVPATAEQLAGLAPELREHLADRRPPVITSSSSAEKPTATLDLVEAAGTDDWAWVVAAIQADIERSREKRQQALLDLGKEVERFVEQAWRMSAPGVAECLCSPDWPKTPCPEAQALLDRVAPVLAARLAAKREEEQEAARCAERGHVTRWEERLEQASTALDRLDGDLDGLEAWILADAGPTAPPDWLADWRLRAAALRSRRDALLEAARGAYEAAVDALCAQTGGDVAERRAAGVLPESEADRLVRAYAFAGFHGFTPRPRWEKLVDHDEDCDQYMDGEVGVERADAGELTASQWTTLQALRAVLPEGYTVQPERVTLTRGGCGCEAEAVVVVATVSVRWHGRGLTRQYLLG